MGELTIAGPANHWAPGVKSVVPRKRVALRGIRLFSEKPSRWQIGPTTLCARGTAFGSTSFQQDKIRPKTRLDDIP